MQRSKVLEPSALLTQNLALIERAVAFACHRYQFDSSDAEELLSIVKLKLIDNDYALLRTFQERSRFSTWISVVVQRMALDYRIAAWGKWHATAEAKRLGPLAVELEQLLHRDSRTLDEAAAILGAKHGATRAAVQALAEKLPSRAPRRRQVPIEHAEHVASAPAAAERVLDAERSRMAKRVSEVVSEHLAARHEEDRLIVQLRFEGGMTVAEIARSLHLDQKLLYRRIAVLLRELEQAIGRAGISAPDVAELIGGDEPLLHFAMGNRDRRPSIGHDEDAATHSEASE